MKSGYTLENYQDFSHFPVIKQLSCSLLFFFLLISIWFFLILLATQKFLRLFDSSFKSLLVLLDLKRIPPVLVLLLDHLHLLFSYKYFVYRVSPIYFMIAFLKIGFSKKQIFFFLLFIILFLSEVVEILELIESSGFYTGMSCFFFLLVLQNLVELELLYVILWWVIQ